jgi:hypothetical protein
MANPYVQVALTYVHRARSWARIGYLIAAGISVAFVFFVMIMAALEGEGRGNHQVFFWWQLMPFAFIYGIVVVHVREQFANSRARLTPDFCRVHAVIAGAAAVLCAVLLPAAFASVIGWSPVGFAAVTLLLFAAVFWAVLSPSRLTAWPVLIGWLLFVTEPGKGCVQQLVSGHFEYQAVGILAVGVVIVLLGGIRLIRLNEDMPWYLCPMWNCASRQVEVIAPRGARDSVMQRLILRAEDKRMASLNRHARRASTSRWSRVCRWQVDMLTTWSAMWSAIGFVLAITVGGSTASWIMNKSTTHMIGVQGLSLAMFGSLMPGGIAWGALWRRRKLRSRESLMGVDRASYLTQVGMAAALGQLQMWLGMAAASVLWWCCVVQQPLSVALAYVLAFSALSQPAFFGLNVWLLQFQSRIPGILAWMAYVVAVAFATVGMELRPASSAWPLVLVAAAISAVLGLILTWHAYRRWLVADSD